MNYRQFALSLGLTCICGCATSPVAEDPRILQRIGDRFVGSPLTEAIARYGMPHTQRDFQGMKVYTWHVSTTKQWQRPITTHTIGTVGTNDGWLHSQVPYVETTHSSQYVSVLPATENRVELKDFIYETLAQIVGGVVDARNKINALNANARVNPYLDPMADQLAKHGLTLAGGDAVQLVEFEVSITAKDVSGTKDGVGIFVIPFTLGSSGQSSSEQSGSSKISFRVPLTLPRELEG